MNHPSVRNEIIELADAFSTQQLDAEGAKRLEELLSADRSHLQFYVEYMDHLAVLSTRFLTDDPETVIRKKLVVSGSKRRLRKLHWQLLLTNSALTLLLLCAVLGIYQLVIHNPFGPRAVVVTAPAREPIARIAGSIDGRWTIQHPADENSVRTSDDQTGVVELYVGDEIFLEHGLLEILFDNKAKVLLHGNSSCRVTGENGAYLAYGKAVSEVPASAVGFRLDSSTLKVCDLGTRFALNAENDGTTELTVSEGHVMVGLKSASEDKQVWQSLHAGQAVSYLPSIGSITSAPYSFKVFSYIDAALAGMTDYQGHTMATAHVEDLGKQLDVIAAAPIFRGKTFSVPIRFELVKDVWNPQLIQPQGQIQPGVHLPCDVFLVQRKSRPGAALPSGPIEGQIRFSLPIIGAILTPKGLSQIDKLFPEGKSPLSSDDRRGVEIDNASDVVRISEDRHTLNLKLSSDDAIDQLIVFTAGF